MKTLRSFVGGKWVEGKEPFATLVNPATEEPLARTSTNGIDFGAALELSREQGGPALRELTFAQRGELLKAWSKALHAARDELIALAMQNGGNTRSDGPLATRASISGSRATASPCMSTPSTSPPGAPARKRPARSWRECR
jgi:acyl-CoA reductase-like NAD-dependent aldehyde dehydrogenase